jgi:hypothetical protein
MADTGSSRSSLGPVEVAVVEFPGSRFDGRIAPALAEVIETGVVSILDLVFITKNTDGSTAAFELADLGEGDDARAYLELDGAAGGLLGESDLQRAAELLEPGSSAAIIVWENSWARRLVTAIRDSGGRLVAHDRLDAETVQTALDGLDSQPPA